MKTLFHWLAIFRQEETMICAGQDVIESQWAEAAGDYSDMKRTEKLTVLF